MAKSSKADTSKSKSQKNIKAVSSWREKLAEYDINNIYTGRTCEIILMAELTIRFSEAVSLFDLGARNNPTSVVKSISFGNFINDVRQGKEDNETKSKTENGKPKGDRSKSKSDPLRTLFQSAAAEANEFLKAKEHIPLELMAPLIKLKIINMINEDVALRDKERNLELDKLNLCDNNDTGKKEKSEKGAKKEKGKSKVAANLPVEERKLYFLLNGFYEPDLIQELWTIGVPLSAILELVNPDSVFRENYTTKSGTFGNSFCTLSESLASYEDNPEEPEEEKVLFINQNFQDSKESVRISTSSLEQSEACVSSSTQPKINDLYCFWNKIYKELEGELQSKLLENAAHVRVTPLSVLSDDKDPQEVFLEISKEILKLSDVKRQHLNYLRHVKIWEVKSEVVDVPRSSLKTYKKLMDVVPPDCFTVGLFLHCLLEEICSRVPDPKPLQSMKSSIENPLEPSNFQAKCGKESVVTFKNPKNVFRTVAEPSRTDISVPLKLAENYKPLEKLARYVIQFRKKRSPFSRSGITYHGNKSDPKMHLEISKEPFTIHESNWLGFKLNPYQQLSQELLRINLDILKKCSSALLWQLYSQLGPIEVVYKNHQLQTWSRILNLGIDEIQYAISAIGFDMLACPGSAKKESTTKDALQILLPAKNNSELLKLALPKVKYMQTPDIPLTSLVQKRSCIKIPYVAYSNVPNIYESKNVPAYLWYEKLSPTVMLQQLEKANFDYVCVDHQYCPYNDAIMLRYHNDVDAFGVNSRICTEFLRTPVCFRDFCKYIIHEEARWLENKEDGYQDKLKEDLSQHPAEEIPKANEKVAKDLKQNTEENRATSKEKLSSFCAKPGELYSFLAYDVGEARIQLTGATTTFHSLDGYKITVDRTSFIGKPKNLSLNVSITDHSFIFHYSKLTLNEPLMFHFCLADGTIVVFTKPPKKHKPEVTIAEKIYKTSKPEDEADTKTAFQPREKNFYCVVEEKRFYLKSVEVPFVTHRSLLLSEDRTLAYLKQMEKLNFPLNTKGKSKRQLRTSTPLKCYNKSSNKFEDFKKVVTLYVASNAQNNNKLHEKTDILKTNVAVSEPSRRQSECKEILKKIKAAKKWQIPMFKVYSSKLHKFEYIKRAKSYILIKIGKHTISLLCKHPFYKTSRDVEVVKAFPIKLTNSEFPNNNCYDMKTSLPSGLLIYTLPGADNAPFNIKQRYVEKGPQCRNIAGEYSRTFMRNGHVVIKKCDGTLDILSANGQIVHCKVPHSITKTLTKYRANTKQKFHYGKDKKSRLTKSESKLHRVVNWRRRHIIGGAESRYLRCRRIYLRSQKLRPKNSSEIYVMQKNANSLFEYTLITPDGKQLKITDQNVKKEGKIFQAVNEDEDYDERMHLRDDGTRTILRGGLLTTQFNDQTKISSWFTESADPVIISNEENFYESELFNSFQFFETEEWILVQIFYKFEHPNYATVLYSSDDYETEIDLPNDVVMNVTENGHYFLDFDGVASSVINEELVYLESRSCDVCMQRSITVVNVKPLYNQAGPIAEDTELLKTCDSYEKVFVVNYGGKCFRNSNYVKRRTNRVECEQHDKQDHQQLFVLNRDLSGSKFWDVRTFRKRMAEVVYNNNTVIQYYGKNANAEDYTCLELRTYQRKPYHMYFVNRSFKDDVMLSAYQAETNSPSPAYTATCQIYSMPKQCTIDLLKASIVENSKEVEFPKLDDNTTLFKCISQNARENLKLKEKPVPEEHQKKSTSALSLFKRWYTWHEFNKPYVPPTLGRVCKCKSELYKVKTKKVQPRKVFKHILDRQKWINQQTLLEIHPDQTSSDSLIEPYQKPHKTVCECHLPAHFLCDCKPTTTEINSEKRTKFSKAEIEEKFDESHNMEAKNRISSIRGWSDEVDTLHNVYVLAEEALRYSDLMERSVWDTIVRKEKVYKPPQCDCSTRKHSSQNKTASESLPKTVCAEDSCKRRNRSKLASVEENPEESNTEPSNNELHERQAAGEDQPQNFLNVKKSEAALDVQKQRLLEELQRKIIMLVSSTTKKESAEKAKHYKISVANRIISTILQAHFNASELMELLKNLNSINIRKNGIPSAEELLHIILSQSDVKITRGGIQSSSVPNSALKLTTKVHVVSNKQNESKVIKFVKTRQPIKQKQDNTEDSKVSAKKLQSKRRNMGRIKQKP